MKTKKIFILAFLFVTNFTFAQIVEKGAKLLDVYYGWPNLWTNTAKNILTNDNSTNIKVGSLGPLGGRIEYLASDKVGFGLDLNYAVTTVKWSERYVDPNGNNAYYNYDVSVPRFRALFCFNFHFGGSENFDAYWKLGAGYASWSVTSKSNDPNYKGDRVDFNLLPFAIRTGVGARYFFTENFQANVELGLGGGPLMTFGLGTKF
jgi:hypothetical protein